MLDIKECFAILEKEFNETMCSPSQRATHCPIKKIENLTLVDGVSVERRSFLSATLRDGTSGVKEIYVNDITGEYREKITMSDDIVIVNKGITTFRCGLMTALAISKFAQDFESVGFIGTGRTNIQNCKAITEIFGQKRVVIRGSKKDREKNANAFADICGAVYVDDTDDLAIINGCDIVVVCTSSYKKEDLISTELLSEPGLIVALDSGYLLDESFRQECESYTDYIEQLEAYYDEEFPYDTHRYEIFQIGDKEPYANSRVVVYLHGIGLADIVAAKFFYEKGMKK